MVGSEMYSDICALRLAHLLSLQNHQISVFVAPSADQRVLDLSNLIECDLLEAHELPYQLDLVVTTLTGSNKFEVWKAELDGHLKNAQIHHCYCSTRQPFLSKNSSRFEVRICEVHITNLFLP